MPRTKQPRKTRSIRETTEESDSLVRDFERQAAQRFHKVEADLSMQISMLANSIDVAQAGLPMEIRKLTLGQLLALEIDNVDDDDDVLMETTNESSEISSNAKNARRAKKIAKRATAVSDDGYATESTTIARTTHVTRINDTKNSNKRQPRKRQSSSISPNNNQNRPPRMTRSLSRNRNSKITPDTKRENRNDLLKTVGRCPTSSKYKTPSTKNHASSFSVVTPKIRPNTAMNIMRRPRQGEMVLSMQGSPLLVSSIVQEQTANINVPLKNGDVISLLPNPGLRLSQMPAMNAETMEQLRTLNKHLNVVMGTM